MNLISQVLLDTLLVVVAVVALAIMLVGVTGVIAALVWVGIAVWAVGLFLLIGQWMFAVAFGAIALLLVADQIRSPG